jgi:hypothetical protein
MPEQVRHVGEYCYPNADIVAISRAGMDSASTRWRRVSGLPDRDLL